MLKRRRIDAISLFGATFFCLLTLFWPVAPVLGLSNYEILNTPFYDPSGDAGSECSTLVGGDHETQTWNYFKSKGLSDQQTAGIMGNMQQESSFNPLIMQKGGESENPYDAGTLGWGLIQWSGNNEPTGDKVTQLYNASGLTGPISQLSTQLDLVWHHMHNDPPITKGDFNISDFENITDEKQAAQYFLNHIEAGTDPIDPHTGQPVREENATNILNHYAGNDTGDTGGSSSSCGVSVSSSNCSVNSIVYSAEYSQEQLTKIFGDPGTKDSHSAMDANLTSVDFLGHSVSVNKVVASCLEAVASDLKSNNISYSITDVGCYRFDSDNGTSNIGLRSYHTYGAACDINALTNNYYNTGDHGTRPYDPNCPPAASAVNSGNCYSMSPQVVQIFAAHGFYWGGNFNSVKDYMHFEWHGVVP